MIVSRFDPHLAIGYLGTTYASPEGLRLVTSMSFEVRANGCISVKMKTTANFLRSIKGIPLHAQIDRQALAKAIRGRGDTQKRIK